MSGNGAAVLETLGVLIMMTVVIIIVADVTGFAFKKTRRHRTREKQEEEQFNEDSPLWPGV